VNKIHYIVNLQPGSCYFFQILNQTFKKKQGNISNSYILIYRTCYQNLDWLNLPYTQYMKYMLYSK